MNPIESVKFMVHGIVYANKIGALLVLFCIHPARGMRREVGAEIEERL